GCRPGDRYRSGAAMIPPAGPPRRGGHRVGDGAARPRAVAPAGRAYRRPGRVTVANAARAGWDGGKLEPSGPAAWRWGMKLDELLERAGQSITVRRVFADPYEKDGVTVIAGATVSGGGGGGGGHDQQGQQGEGGGFGLK